MRQAVVLDGAHAPVAVRRAFGMSARIVVGLAAAAAMAVVIAGTRFGPGVSPDSATYIGAARSLLAGAGLSEPFGESAGTPLTRFPPAYPSVLAGLGLLTGDPASAARWAGAALFGLTAILLAWILAQSTGKAALASALAALLYLSAPAMLRLHLMAWSEPLFLALCAAWLALLLFALRSGKMWIVVAAGAVAALASLTRYVGIALVVAGAVSLLAWGEGTFGHRVRRAAVFAMVGAGPLAVWLGRNAAVAGSAAGRELAFHPIGMSHVWQAAETVGQWLLLPASVHGAWRLALIAAAGLMLVTLLAGRSRPDREVAQDPGLLTRVVGAFLMAYVLTLVLSVSLVDANTPFDDRILAPVFLAGAVLVALAAARVQDRRPQVGAARLILAAAIGVFLVASLISEIAVFTEAYQIGIGFNRAEWRQSQTVALVRELPTDVLLYANSPEAIYLHTGRSAQQLPRRFDSVAGRPNGDFERALQSLGERLAQEQGVVAFFSAVSSDNLPTAAELEGLSGLRVAARTEDGLILRAAQP